MKRTITIAAALFMVAAAATSASAEMVSAGLIEMEKTEVEYLQGLVSGHRTFARPASAGHADADADLVNISAADMADLRDYISGRAEFEAAQGKDSSEKMVNIGLVRMKASDVADIEQKVSQGHAKRIAQLHK